MKFIFDGNRRQTRMLLRILAAAAMTVALAFIPVHGVPRFLLYIVPYLTVGYDILLDAAKGLWNRQLLDENFLMAIATVGALVLGAMDGGEYLEAVAVMLFYQIGELFQSYAVGKSRKSIRDLMDIRPDYANVLRDGMLVQVDPEQVDVGTIIWVQPGERIPIDGVVVEGASTLNTSALTGESLPKDVGPGDTCFSGCINQSGLLQLRTSRPFGESTVSRILELVENASSNKSKSEKFISKFARVYTPAVCIGALVLAVLPPVISLMLASVPQWGQWLYRALTFLVVSCPCALVISIPLSFFAGIGSAGRAGVLVKGSNYLEALSKVKTVVFDKTGTLTQGVFAVARVCPQDGEAGQLLEYAALAESASGHPISRSLQQAWGKTLDRNRVRDIQEFAGWGVTAKVDGVSVAAGNEKLMERLGIAYAPCLDAGTVVYVGLDGRYAGCILISDAVKPSAVGLVEELKAVGIDRCWMLTGDTEAVAAQTAEALQLDGHLSGLMPADKVAAVERLLTEQAGGKLAFVGDGVNDAPVLARADIGIAMGAMGSDAAIEAADGWKGRVHSL